MHPAPCRLLALLLCRWAVSAEPEVTSPGPGPGPGPNSGCCKVKKITGPKELSGTYYLTEEDVHSSLPSDCQDNCTYVRDSGTERFCFKPSSTYSAQCKGSCGLEKKHVCSSGPAQSIDNARLCTVAAMKELDWAAVQRDLRDLMTDSKAEWPADYGHYGPLMIRLAWHTAGSYRRSDGRGGADGARQRFEPERSWADNTNLDKARTLLWPIKLKYGRGLSWGDLMVLAGNTAIEDMGGDILGFCAGRLDDQDGSDSELLGPTPAQAAFMPCMRHRICQEPLGTSTVGLIYVNPEGILPDAEGLMSAAVPSRSVPDIRDTFARMNMNDQETVALIGGGHAFGKTHGACPFPPGPSPQEDPVSPWPGKCGSGKGEDAYTSGFEFPWTTNPKRWDNEYFQNILNYEWTHGMGPGNRTEWKVYPVSASPLAPSAGNTDQQHIGMLTTDLALREDQTYLDLIRLYASNRTAIDHDFMHVWYKLTTRDMGPHARCLGPLVPPPQPWQYPLPHPPAELADFTLVKAAVDTLMGGDLAIQKALVRLAWRCAATFRATDYLGGCSGARVRLSPQKDWPVNANLDLTLARLEPIKATFGSSLSWSDLIVLAGAAALERASGVRVPFCGGRTDAETDAGASDLLKPKITGAFTDSLEQLKEAARLKGLTQREFALLNAAGYALGDPAVGCTGLFCSRNGDMDGELGFNNRFFITLLTETWVEHSDPGTGWKGYKAQGSGRRMLATDLWYRSDGVLRAIAEEYSDDNDKFVRDAVMAWDKLMIADRFDGPAGNLCHS